MNTGISYKIKWGFLLGILIVLSCNKDNREEFFEMNHVVDFEVPPGLNTFDTHFFLISPLPSIYDEKLAASGKLPSDVVTIEAKEAFLSSVFNDINLRHIYSVSVYIFDPFNPSDKIEFFYLDPVPNKNQTSIQLFPGLADLTHWVDQEFFGVEVRLTFREITSSATEMRLEFDLRALGE